VLKAPDRRAGPAGVKEGEDGGSAGRPGSVTGVTSITSVTDGAPLADERLMDAVYGALRAGLVP